MATKDDNLELELAHYQNFKTYITWPDKLCQWTLDYLTNAGVTQISTLFERAISDHSGIKIISEDGRDFVDWSDAKLSSVRTMSYGTCYSAPVTNVYTKKGTLRVQVYERKQNKYYYYKIPNWAYAPIPKSSNIEIPFELDGTPRRIRKGMTYANMWDFEVTDFKDMASPLKDINK